jgi:hypothetical protein
MQRTVEQRHHRPIKRRAVVRHDPRRRFLGFSPRQWPFILVLVGNWAFSLAFFLGMKEIWHWQPDAWGIADRLALVIKGSVFALLPGVIGIIIVAAQRLDPSMWVGRTPKPNSAVDINNKFILNTFEQFTAYFVANAGLAIYCPLEEARSLPLLTMLFVIGRILFWVGYHQNPYLRAFGFGVTFYPTVMAFFWLILIMVFDIRIPL